MLFGQAELPDGLVQRLEPHDVVIVGVIILCFGMIGTCFGVIIWQMRNYLRDRRGYVAQLVGLVEKVTGVIDHLTAVIDRNTAVTEAVRTELSGVRQAMQLQPCMLLKDPKLRRAWEEALETATEPGRAGP